MHLLAFGDLHLKPSGTTVRYDQLKLPDGTDVLITIGDVVDRTDPESLAVGRDFFERLAAFERPVLSVPGNHDPQEHHEQLVDDLDGVVNAHGRVVTADTLGMPDAERRLTGHSFVGWGCETFDQTAELRAMEFPALEPRETIERSERRHAADKAAQRLEDAVFDYVRDNQSRAELIESLGIEHENRARFEDGLDRTRMVYEGLDSLLQQAPSTVVLLSHVPPYNTRVDRHHSVGMAEADLDMLHCGSLGLKLALRARQPVAALNGHSHCAEYEPGDGPGGRPHVINLGYRGVASVTVDGTGDEFGFERFGE